jgi:hypothetical protein
VSEGIQVSNRVVLKPVEYGGGWRVDFIISPAQVGMVERRLRRSWYRYERKAADGNSKAGGYYHSRDSAESAIYCFLLLPPGAK